MIAVIRSGMRMAVGLWSGGGTNVWSQVVDEGWWRSGHESWSKEEEAA
jgi:hypothetical protein